MSGLVHVLYWTQSIELSIVPNLSANRFEELSGSDDLKARIAPELLHDRRAVLRGHAVNVEVLRVAMSDESCPIFENDFDFGVLLVEP